MPTIEVPEDSDSPIRAPVARPDDPNHTVRYRRTGVEIETERFEDPPDDYEVVSGEAHPCEECNALFSSQQALAGHSGSHSDGE